MGMTDQRGDWRRVVTDGQRQAQAEEQGENPLPAEAWGTTSPGGQRSIRLLPDSAAGRVPGRVRLVQDCEIDEGADQAPVSDSDPCPIEDQGQVDRHPRLRSDETHAPRAVEPQGVEGRAPGPLRANLLRQRRGSGTSDRRAAQIVTAASESAGHDH